MNGIELVESTSDIGYLTDSDGIIHGWNAAAEECFDLAADQVIGRPCWEILRGRDAFGNIYCGQHCPLMRMALAGERIQRCELFVTDSSGESNCYSLATLVLRGFEPMDPAIVHLLHPTFKERRRQREEAVASTGNHLRGELTAREREVLTQLGKGRGTAEIAKALRISDKTARNHIQRILHKLHAHSRLEAVAVAREAKLL